MPTNPATMNNEPRIYVACLAAYNSGKLHGAWINANQDPDDIEAEIKAMLAKSPEAGAEEWAIHDTDNFMGADVSEFASFESVSELAKALDEHGAAYAAYMGCVGKYYATPEGFADSYHGHYSSPADYAEELLNSMGDLNKIPESLRNYFDFEAYARDMEHNGYSFIHGDGGFYVFSD